MVNKRLTWFLESNNHISRFQSGFRSDRSTTDNLVRLETFIRDAFIKKEHVVAVFFDLEKAYDTTWRYGILKDIHKLGLRGRLPTFIENFLADRAMQVRVGSSLSDYYDQEQGVPQGGVLSTTLFSIKINDIVKCLGNLTDCSYKFIIFSDSLSVLKAMNHTSSKNPQIQKLLEKCHELLTYKEIVLCWIPSHIGIQGNEMVDKQAKTSLSLEPTSFKIPFSNFKPSINKYILEEWQTSWNNSIGNKLLDIKPTIGEYQSVVRNIRREEVVLARLRLGHTRVTHSYLLQGEEHPQCVGCDAPFTVRHFLLECGDFAQVRNNCFHVNNMKELFQDIHIDSIMTFLRQINLFNKI